MLTRYSTVIYCPSLFDRFCLVPRRKIQWGKVRSDIKRGWNWLQEKISPTPNPFDIAWNEMISELIFEGV